MKTTIAVLIMAPIVITTIPAFMLITAQNSDAKLSPKDESAVLKTIILDMQKENLTLDKRNAEYKKRLDKIEQTEFVCI